LKTINKKHQILRMWPDAETFRQIPADQLDDPITNIYTVDEINTILKTWERHFEMGGMAYAVTRSPAGNHKIWVRKVGK